MVAFVWYSVKPSLVIYLTKEKAVVLYFNTTAYYDKQGVK